MILSISGCSAVGKTTLAKSLIQAPNIAQIRTITSRKPRAGETSDDYIFASEQEIRQMDDLLWNVEIHGNLYAFGKDETDSVLQKNNIGVVVVTSQYHKVIRLHYPKTISIHLVRPSKKEIARRLRLRGDTHTQIESRLLESDLHPNHCDALGVKFLNPGTSEEILQKTLAFCST